MNEDCGCKIDLNFIDKIQGKGLEFSIIYCPAHKAAPDLATALEELLSMAKYYKPFSGEYPPPMDEDEETWAIGQVYNQAEQALAKVKE